MKNTNDEIKASLFFSKTDPQSKPNILIKFPLDDRRVKRVISDSDEIQALVDRFYDGGADESYSTWPAIIYRFGTIVCLQTNGKRKAVECPSEEDAQAVFGEGEKLLQRAATLSVY